jgi:hypothetical protein
LQLNEIAEEKLLQEEIERQIAERDGLKDAPLKRFGLELFDREISTFAPVDNMPPPDGYRVGPGDNLSIYMYGNEEADLALVVNREGQLVLPRLGPLAVAGLTFKEAKNLIRAKVASQLVGTEGRCQHGQAASNQCVSRWGCESSGQLLSFRAFYRCYRCFMPLAASLTLAVCATFK